MQNSEGVTAGDHGTAVDSQLIRPDWGWTKEPPQQWQWALSTSSDDAGILDYTRVFGYHKLGDQCPNVYAISYASSPNLKTYGGKYT
jgi:hypothetical protein